MTFLIIIFFVSILLVFGMLYFRVWEIRTSRVQISENRKYPLLIISFRYIEKNMLYLTKYIVQEIIFILAKYWFIVITKIKKWFNNKWPKINSYFTNKKNVEQNTSYRHSFFQKAILESKAKIKNIKEEVKEKNEEEESNNINVNTPE